MNRLDLWADLPEPVTATDCYGREFQADQVMWTAYPLGLETVLHGAAPDGKATNTSLYGKGGGWAGPQPPAWFQTAARAFAGGTDTDATVSWTSEGPVLVCPDCNDTLADVEAQDTLTALNEACATHRGACARRAA